MLVISWEELNLVALFPFSIESTAYIYTQSKCPSLFFIQEILCQFCSFHDVILTESVSGTINGYPMPKLWYSLNATVFISTVILTSACTIIVLLHYSVFYSYPYQCMYHHSFTTLQRILQLSLPVHVPS